MAERIVLEIPGKPMGKQRPRHMRNGHTYTPKETVNYEAVVRERFIAENPGFEPFDGPVSVAVNAFFAVPKSVSKKQRELMLICWERPTKKPDADNIGKIITDALNGLAYLDDKQVVDLRVQKFYTKRDSVMVFVKPLVCGAKEQA